MTGPGPDVPLKTFAKTPTAGAHDASCALCDLKQMLIDSLFCILDLLFAPADARLSSARCTTPTLAPVWKL